MPASRHWSKPRGAEPLVRDVTPLDWGSGSEGKQKTESASEAPYLSTTVPGPLTWLQ
jgi:hypothetical protein